MAERSFTEEVKKLRAGDGEIFKGEGILAITKALLQSGVSYVGGYQGSPISHLMDVLNDAQEILGELGVHFEANGSEATAAIEFIQREGLNEVFEGRFNHVGIITCGGSYNTVIRALQRQGLADVYGATDIPIYCLNVAYPLVPDELIRFCADKEQVLVLEEGQPEYIEQGIQTALRRADVQTRVFGKDIMPMAGEYTGQVMLLGITRFLSASRRHDIPLSMNEQQVAALETPLVADDIAELMQQLPPRPAGLCTGCPERPLFSALKQVQEEMGPFHISSDIGCHSFATAAPFNLGNTIMGYGLSLASSSGVRHALPHKAISIMGDGGFWHNGLTSGVASAVFNGHDGLLIVIDNGYSAATGGQDIPSLVEPNLIASTIDADRPKRDHWQSIEEACRGAGVKWIRTISTYNIESMKQTLRDALSTSAPGLKVIVAEGECMLNRQRRVKPLLKQAITTGKRVTRSRFYIDPATCTGDHGCIRLSGCPSLTVRENPDPLRTDPVSYVDNTCVGCGVCGTNAHSAVLCPSFTRVDLLHNPNAVDRVMTGIRRRVHNWWRRRDLKRQQEVAL